MRNHPNTFGAIFVTLPSQQYAAYIPQDRYSRQNAQDGGPIVQVAQRINGEWHGTPAQYYAKDASQPAREGQEAPRADRVWIDHGQRWGLDTSDTIVFRAFAAGVYLSWEETTRQARQEAGADHPGTGATIDELRALLTGEDATQDGRNARRKREVAELRENGTLD